jgi:hypothetical protein
MDDSSSIDSLPSPTQLEPKDNDIFNSSITLQKCKIKNKKYYDIEKKIGEKFNKVKTNAIKTKKKKPKKNRCAECRKKLGIVPFECKCKRLYCNKHRYAEDHNCAYDYKSEYKKIFKKNNPKVVAEKIIRI